MKKKESVIKAFLFDLDDTLYDCTGQLVDSAQRRAAGSMVRAGLPLSQDEAYSKIIEVIDRYGPRANVFDILCEQYDVDLSVAEAGLNAYNTDTHEPIKPFSETVPVLAELRVKYTLLLVTTGVSRRQQWKIDQLGIAGLFKDIMVNDLETGRPKDECFQRLLEKHRLKPENVVCVGDRVHSEIKVANRLGMHTAQMLHGRYRHLSPKSDLEEPDYKISNLRQLLLLPGKIGGRHKLKKSLKPQVVAIGGGTGLPIVLNGLKNSCDLTAVVTVTDTGKSSGKLREEYHILPPGDIRNCLIALSESEKLMLDLFQYRFSEGTFKGHAFGNIFLTTLTQVTGSFSAALKEAHKILAIQGSVLPSTLDSRQLIAECEDGAVIKGETAIAYRKNTDSKIIRVSLSPPAAKSPEEVAAKISLADAIVIGPGSLFTSIITNLLAPEIRSAIAGNNKATLIYIANIVTDKAQTRNFSAMDHLDVIEQYLENGAVDYMLVNSKKPSEEMIKAYREEDAEIVSLPEAEESGRAHKDAITIMARDLLEKIPESPASKRFWWEKRKLLRHDPDKLGTAILSILGDAHDRQ